MVVMRPVPSMVPDGFTSAKGPRPTLMLAYGAYGEPYPMHFQLDIYYALTIGWNVAIAQVRYRIVDWDCSNVMFRIV
jgi:protease II